MKPMKKRTDGQSASRAALGFAGVLVATGVLHAQQPQTGQPPALPANLVATRAALDKYQDPIAADSAVPAGTSPERTARAQVSATSESAIPTAYTSTSSIAKSTPPTAGPATTVSWNPIER